MLNFSSFAFAQKQIKLELLPTYSFTSLNVLELFSEDCPFSQRQYGFENLQLNQEFFLKRNLNWFLINLNDKKTLSETHPYFKELNLKYPKHFFIVNKDSFLLAKSLFAKVTPTVYLFNKHGEILYHGAIENSDPFSKIIPSEVDNYLIKAYLQIKEKKNISHKYIKSVGCPIKYP